MPDQPIAGHELRLQNDKDYQRLKAGDFSKTGFWYYTSLDTANKILEGHCFHVHNLSQMNDLGEATLHEKEKEFIHALCFCNSGSEKIPMWYLYAGITGQGGSIGFTPSTMLKLIKSVDKIYTVDGGTFLEKEKDFDLQCGWVYYRKRQTASQVLYRGQWFSISDDTSQFETENYFIKDYPWMYEKEFRLVIRNKTKTPYEKLVLYFPDALCSDLKIKLAPELAAKNMADLLHGNNGFLKVVKKKLLKSDLEIEMSLLPKNKAAIMSYIGSSSCDIDYDELCKTISSMQKCHPGELHP